MDMNLAALVLIGVVVAVVVFRSGRKAHGGANGEPLPRPPEPRADEWEEIETAVPPAVEPVMVWKDGKETKGELRRMAQGLQVFDENGVLVVDVTDRLCKTLGVVTMEEPDGAFSDPRIAGLNVWVAVRMTKRAPLVRKLDFNDVSAFTPEITVNGTTISWKWGRVHSVLSFDFWLGFGFTKKPVSTFRRVSKMCGLELVYGVY